MHTSFSLMVRLEEALAVWRDVTAALAACAGSAERLELLPPWDGQAMLPVVGKSLPGEDAEATTDASAEADLFKRDAAPTEQAPRRGSVAAVMDAIVARRPSSDAHMRDANAGLADMQASRRESSEKAQWTSSAGGYEKRRRPYDPRKRCAAVWRSVRFWRVFPWLVALAIIAVADVYTLMFGAAVFDECPEAIATISMPPRGWAWTVLLSLLQSWLVFDPLVILIRNNLRCTRTRVRTHKYQVAEKGALGPLRMLANALADFAAV
jgi:anti-sigma-K factor RskA